jgi:protein-disulfide isomerase
MQKWFWWVIIIVVAVMLGIFFLGKDDTSGGGLPKYDPEVVQLQDYIWGFDATGKTEADLQAFVADKPVLIEYADFQCPGCAYFALMSLYPAKEEFADRVIFVYRHYPLINMHQNAMAAHRAAAAAANQGKFWEMHDILYERRDSWVEETSPSNMLESYASELGLDIEKFKLDVESADTYSRIDNDMESSKQYDIGGTPTLFLDGQEVEGDAPPTYEQLRTLLNEAIAKKTAT